MRLTLRTLLSYLDNVLDKAAHDELDQQINSSEHAAEWIHRTRDVMRRLKLEAPPIHGDGLADDPNTVAEYLDRTLPEQGVAEFERVCLESDSMLAEVASCHHALAMFLNEEAPIDPDTRRRLHRLQSDLDQTLSSRPTSPPAPLPTQDAPPANSPAAPVAASAAPEGSDRVPEYLRASDRPEWVRWAPAIAALLLLMVTCVIAFGPGGPLAKPDEPVATRTDPTPEPNSEDPSEQPPSEEPAETEEEISPSIPDDATQDEDETEPPEGPSAETESTDSSESVDPVDSPPVPTEVEPAVEQRPTEDPPEPVKPTTIKPGQADGFTTQYLGAESGLAVVGVEPAGWRRLVADEPLATAAPVIVLPTSRATIALSESFRAVIAGPAELLIDRDPDGTPTLDLRYGRLLLANDASNDAIAKAVVVIDGVPHNTTISGGGALALEADRLFTPGWPVLETPAPLTAVANSLAGVIEWSTRGEEIRISKPKRWLVADSPESPAPAGFGSPDWVERERLSEVARRASAEIASAVSPEQPVTPQLLEIAGGDPFRENRALAAACNTLLGRPETLVGSFGDKGAKDDWAVNLDRLRKAASRSPDAAEAIVQSFAEMYGDRQADELLELLVGFMPEEFGRTPQEVANGVAVEILLPALASDELATRVIGSLVLTELIEPYEPAYRPLATSRRRITAVRKLESMIEDAELVPRVR